MIAEGATRRLVDYWNGRGAWARTSERLREFLLACLPQTMPTSRRSARCRAGRTIPGIACPTLVVMGLDLPLPSLRVTELVARAIPGAELAIVPDAGHMLPLTDPHLLDPMIARHLMRASADALAMAS